jgi:hypothetical protein
MKKSSSAANKTNDSISSSFLGSSTGSKIAGIFVKQKSKSNKSMCPSLTMKQRVIGYVICSALGMHLTFVEIMLIRIYSEFILTRLDILIGHRKS